MIKEFKEFIAKGNVVDLAVAVILGAAFGLIVKSFTDDILGGILAALGGKPNFSDLTFAVGNGVVRYGSFLTAVINFLIVALALFVVVKAINRMQKLRKSQEEQEARAETEVELLAQIRDALVLQTTGTVNPRLDP
jgi:large conductance mechanosensitive channel